MKISMKGDAVNIKLCIGAKDKRNLTVVNFATGENKHQ